MKQVVSDLLQLHIQYGRHTSETAVDVTRVFTCEDTNDGRLVENTRFLAHIYNSQLSRDPSQRI